MNIVSVRIREFLGIKSLDVRLEPGVNVVSGKNGAGKSSFMKAITKALFGGRGDGPWIIHRTPTGDGVGLGPSDTAAEILVELSGEVRVRRRIPENGPPSLQVTSKFGPQEVAIKEPQKYLRTLVGAVGLDPIEFYRADPADRRRILLAAVPPALTRQDVRDVLLEYLGVEGDVDENGRMINRIVDDAVALVEDPVGLDAIQTIETSLMGTRRTVWGEKEHDEEAAKAYRAKFPADYVDAPIPDATVLLQHLEASNARAADVVRRKDRVSACRTAAETAKTFVQGAKDLVVELEKRLADARTRLSEAAEDFDKSIHDLREAESSVKAAESMLDDPRPIRDQLAALDDRRAVRAAFMSFTEHDERARFSAALVKSIDAALRRGVREKLPAILWSRLAGHPIAELKIGMNGDRITVGGVDMDALSQSEQIRLSMKVAEATAGELKTIMVDGFEALDKESRAAFAANHNPKFQYIVAEVSDGPLTVSNQT